MAQIRRKKDGYIIGKNDYKNIVLDFFDGIEFNIHEGSEALAFNCINVDEGHRRSAQGRAEGIRCAACRRTPKISGKQTVTGHNSGKRKHRRSNPAKPGNLSGLLTGPGNMKIPSYLSCPAFFIPNPRRSKHEVTPQNPHHHQ